MVCEDYFKPKFVVSGDIVIVISKVQYQEKNLPP